MKYLLTVLLLSSLALSGCSSEKTYEERGRVTYGTFVQARDFEDTDYTQLFLSSGDFFEELNRQEIDPKTEYKVAALGDVKVRSFNEAGESAKDGRFTIWEVQDTAICVTDWLQQISYSMAWLVTDEDKAETRVTLYDGTNCKSYTIPSDKVEKNFIAVTDEAIAMNKRSFKLEDVWTDKYKSVVKTLAAIRVSEEAQSKE